MANGTDKKLLSDELEKLLKDICTFLNDETMDKVLPQPRKLKAKLLLKRSIEQLESLRGINKTCTTESSLETQATTNSSRGHRCENRKSSIMSELKKFPNFLHEDREFAGEMFEDEVVNGKSGSLHLHKKAFCFQKTKKVFVAIFRHWFIIYANESASKPLHVINLTKYESSACADLPYNVKKKEQSFDVIPIDGSTSFRFTADSPWDMLEWVTAINHSYQKYKPCLVSPLTQPDTHCPVKDCKHLKNVSKELKGNKTQASREPTHGFELHHETLSIKSLDSSDDGSYITVIESSSADSLSAEENDTTYDTLEKINKRMPKMHRSEEIQKKGKEQNKPNLLAHNCKLVTMDIGTYWANKEKSCMNKL